jgi:CARDB/FlgD Ig-like domain/WD40-like Beta Propeller Repeat
VSVVWDGRDDGGLVVADGRYSVVIAAQNGCAAESRAWADVEIDLTPPDVAITQPAPGQSVTATVAVRGRAADPNLASWQLDVACAAAPDDWSLVATNRNEIAPEGAIGAWDTSRAPPGPCSLRLSADDHAQNHAETQVGVTVAGGDFIRQLLASPDVFSPNGDGRRETTTIQYELERQARATLQIRDTLGHLVKALVDGELREPGAHTDSAWDGRDATGQPAADGDYVVWLRAEEPDDASVYAEQSVALILDKTPPALSVETPASGAYVPPDRPVHGSVTDPRLVEYVLTVVPGGGEPVEIARDSHAKQSEDLGSLLRFGDGPHYLRLVASDLAENQATLLVPFTIDSSPPVAKLVSPADGSFLLRGQTPIPVSGSVSDESLESWTLTFGPGAAPAVFSAIAAGSVGGTAVPLGAWDVRSVPDGVYTLRLVASDQAGLTTESRSTVTLDSRPPVAAIESPPNGSYVGHPGPVVGTATDANLAGWTLEVGPGDAASAFKWVEIDNGTEAVEGEELTEWAPLPADGVYTMRLTSRDKVGLTANAFTTVTVDTTPPAAPTGLRAKVTRVDDSHGQVVVTWNPNTEPDLAGYRISRAGADLHEDVLTSPTWDDGPRIEGRYTYSVIAEDKAGNRSGPATLVVLVDLTPPIVSFSFPAEDAAVSGAIDIRGTAYSADDFAEYRLLVGAGTAPPSWTLLRRSTLPVAAGVLGEWLAPKDGDYVLALEADDTNGNHARITRHVVVDTAPPGAPILVEVRPDPQPDRLVPHWNPGSPSDDVIGYLVYRNHRIANAPGVVLGDPRSLVVPGPTYQDDGLPDGEHCYTITAMDAAGNESAPSNEICASLDNRAPHAVIVRPPDGTRFGSAIPVAAESPDLDVDTIDLQIRSAGTGDWERLTLWQRPGPGPIAATPETTLDPVARGLAEGPYELRAVATDLTGHTDPAPAAITVTFGDTTPPAAPTGLAARVDGANVALAWDTSSAPDFDSWSLYRDGQRIAEDLTEPHFDDTGLDPERYEYTVTAVDTAGNESAPSKSAEAIVYQVTLEEPAWLVVPPPAASVRGDGSKPQTTVRVLRDGTPIAEVPASGGAFQLGGVPLVPGGNVLQARGEDAAGNRSILSNEIVLVANTPPAAATAFGASVQDHDVTLEWTDPADADLFGVLVSRDGQRIHGDLPQEEVGWISATVNPQDAQRAFDQNPTTAWTASSPGARWQITFPTPILVHVIRLRFAPSGSVAPPVPAYYRILAAWEGRYVTIARATANAKVVAEHSLPAPFATDSLVVVLDDPGSLAEVTVEKLDAVPAGTGSFEDASVPDGRHTYSVTAIDRYGAESGPTSTDAAVGDATAPGRPTGLVATPVQRDVHLTWNPSPETDLGHYVVLRDGARIGSSEVESYVDAGRPNGTYRYTVLAVDKLGNESAESDPADATIDVAAAPPAAPLILEPTDAAHPVTLDLSRTDVAGRADAGSLVSVETDGVLRGTAPVVPGFLQGTRVALGTGWDLALSPDGNWAAWDIYPDTVALQNLQTGEVRDIPHGGAAGSEHLVFSPDGTSLALTRRVNGPPYWEGLAVLRLADASVNLVLAGRPADYAWSPDGASLAVSLYEGAGTSLYVIDASAGNGDVVDASSGVDSYLRWSPDGRRLAFFRRWSGDIAVLHVFDLYRETSDVLDDGPWLDAPPSWSPDGRRLAWTTASSERLRVRVKDLTQDEPSTDVTEPDADAVAGVFSPDGSWLGYLRVVHLGDDMLLWSIRAIHQQLDLRVTVRGPGEPTWSLPASLDWLGGRLAVREDDQLTLYAPDAGRFVVRGVPLAPGENRLVARATDPTTGLVSTDSETVLVTVPEDVFPDLVVTPDGIGLLPPVPVAGQPAHVQVWVDNRGAQDSEETDLGMTVIGPGGAVVLDTTATLPALSAGGSASLSLPWTPAAAGRYTIRVELDTDGRVAEASETNNTADREIVVAAEEGLAATITSDRASYPALSSAQVTVQIANAGQPFAGTARTTVEDAAGLEVAVLDERPVSLEWGKTTTYALTWNTAATRAGSYFFRVRVIATGEAEPRASAERAFAIESGLDVLARVRPQPVTVAEGAPAAFALSVDNHGANAPIEGATARLQVRPEGSSGPATFETVRTLPSLLPAGAWEATDVWPTAGPAGRYTVTFEVELGGTTVATATAVLTIDPAAAVVQGTLAMQPGHVLRGQSSEARITVTNVGTAGVTGYPLAVEAVSGPEATVHLSVPTTVDLAIGATSSLTLPIETGGLAAGPYTIRLRGGASPVSLDRATLIVHGLIAPPSPHAPTDGARVPTAHPDLVVNDASSPEGAPLTYEFGVFGDQAMTQAMPGAQGVAESPDRTSWRVAAALAEDATYWWRARATDGFSTSAWSAVTAFTVDAVNRPPTAPAPDTPIPGGVVASRQPVLTVRNGLDPERQPLTYELRLAHGADMADVVASQAGIAEGLGLTAWTVPLVLDEDATYYWSAQASDGPNLSPWSDPVSFRVDSVNSSPTAPLPLSPVDGVVVTTHSPALVVQNASDPEGAALTYRFEIDTVPTFDSPSLQDSGELAEGAGETAWTPPLELAENSHCFWRAFASDGNTETASVVADFFVNATNEAPGAPVLLDPVDGRTVGTATPTLTLRNAIDPDGDPLTYEIEVRDAAGDVVAAAIRIPAGMDETSWTVAPALAEDESFTWTARASDGHLDGPWSEPAAFRVDAVVEPPTAPVPLQPAEGAIVEERRPALVVANATSPDHLALTYTFELEAVAADGSTTSVARPEAIPEGQGETEWTPSVDLADGQYQWRARASDPVQDGPWSATAHFEVLVDAPPAAPKDLRATAGDGRVHLDWNASPEPDVAGYKVYRSTVSGGPYGPIAAVVQPSFDDLGLTNGTTYDYVVTATDARQESPYSNEAAARPEASGVLVAEVRYDPATIFAECLLDHDDDDDDDQHHYGEAAGDTVSSRTLDGAVATGQAFGSGAEGDTPACQQKGCPDWLYATLELPAGHDASTIDVRSLRLLGSVAADPAYHALVDVDRDGLRELRVRFRFDRVAPLLGSGTNTATIVGRAGSAEVQGSATILVVPLAPSLRITPRTLQRRSHGEDVQARLEFGGHIRARDVSVSSILLNGVVRVDRLLRIDDDEITVKFDREAVIGVLPLGSSVEVRVSGTLGGLPFVGVDHIRVTQ